MKKELLKELFDYKDGVLYRKRRGRNKHLPQKVAGTDGRKYDAYSYVQIGGKNFLTHRLIWAWFGNTIPKGYELDHINQDKNDNRIENLRLVTSAENKQNKSRQKNNTSGYMGVTKNGNGWIARINSDGVRINLGTFHTLTEAIEVRRLAEIKYGFHENHNT